MTSNYPDVSERLSNTLATWQVLNFQHELEILALSTQGMASEEDVRACERHTKLPDTILGGTIETFDPADWQPDLRFIEIMPDNMRPCAAEALKNYQAFPYELFLWNVSSRRVFHLPHSLQAMLASAELPDIRWSDMLWPFDSFIISLEKPLVITHPADGVEQRLDTVMVSRSKRLDGTPVVLFRLLHVPGKPGKRYGYTRKEVIEFRKLKRKRPAAAVKSMTRKLHELNRHNKNQQGSYNAVLRIGGHNDVIIVEPEALRISHGGVPDGHGGVYEAESTNSYYDGLSVTIRIVVGWMLYLETLSQKSVTWSVPKRTAPRVTVGGASAIIIEPENICNIVGKGRINPSEVTNEAEQRCSKGFVRPHWRRAHYKRPRGSAHNAPKSVRVPPVLVRADLVPLYGIVGGTTTVVISKD
jgi:hypothetical protein